MDLWSPVTWITIMTYILVDTACDYDVLEDFGI